MRERKHESFSLVLEIKRPGEEPRIVLLGPDESLSIGRAISNNVLLPGTGVSRRHARIMHQDGAYWIQDLLSQNGTFLNGESLDVIHRLDDGDFIEIGEHRIEVSFDRTEQRAEFHERDNGRIVRSTEALGLLADEQQRTGQHVPSEMEDADRMLFRKLESVGLALLNYRPLHELYRQILVQLEKSVGAQRCALYLMEGPRKDLLLKASRSQGNDLQRLPISRQTARRALEGREALLLEDGESGNTRVSMLCAPLWDEREVIGLIYADKPSQDGSFGERDLRLFTLIGHLAAAKIRTTKEEELRQQKQRVERELEEAAQIQQRLLPCTALEGEGFTLYGQHIPGQAVSGHYFDYMGNEDGSVTLAMGETGAKGMNAALQLSQLHSRVQAYNEAGLALEETAGCLAEFIHRQMEGGQGVPFFLARYEPAQGKLDYINAGHPASLLCHKDGRISALSSDAKPLGQGGTRDHSVCQVRIDVGERLVISCAGLFSAANSEGVEFGEAGLRQLLSEQAAMEPCQLVRTIIRQVKRYAQSEVPDADLSVLVLQRHQ